VAARNDWYRTSAWDDVARAQFDAKIRRSRAGYNRAQYFWIKAGCMFYARPPDPALRLAAIELVERALVESQAEGSHRAQLLDDLGRYLLIVGRRDDGIAALREALALGLFGTSALPTEILIARHLAERGDRAGAIALYDVAYPPGDVGLTKPSYITLAAREVRDALDQPYRDPEAAAEAIVVYYHALDWLDDSVREVLHGGLEALAAIDRAFRIDIDLHRPHAPLFGYKRAFVEEHFAPELGAYVGRVLCRAGGGSWRPAVPLMQSRVVVGDRALDPFRVAYDAVYYELSLHDGARVLLE
jgi:hypothetical protein